MGTLADVGVELSDVKDGMSRSMWSGRRQICYDISAGGNDPPEKGRQPKKVTTYLGRIKDITIFGSPWINTYN